MSEKLKTKKEVDPTIEINFAEGGRSAATIQLDRKWLNEITKEEKGVVKSFSASLNTVPVSVYLRVYKRKQTLSVSAIVRE